LGAVGLLLLALAAGVSAVAPGDVGGMPRAELAWLLAFAGVAVAVTGWAVGRARPSGRDTAAALVMWAIFMASAASVYLRRDAFAEGALSLADEIGLTQPAATVSGSGEIAVTRRLDGMFVVPARVNDHDTRFLFDTGASAVVLTSETAAAIGLKRETLNFRVPISTANGRALAAPVTLERLAVGPIAFTRVFALVASPGLLQENLLGQSFLQRLGSYEVRGKRLVLRAGNG
jgi:aspartyl protease family protein